MLTAWRYDSDTNEVVVPRSYDPANGRSSKIQACKTCREKKTRCDGDGQNACNRCRCKGLTCAYTTCGKSKKSSSSRPSKSSSSSISKPRRQSDRKNSLLSPVSMSPADYDSSDTLSDKTASPLPCQLGTMDVFDTMPGTSLGNFAIDPLLLQDVQQYNGFENYLGVFSSTADAEMQYYVAGEGVYDGMQAGSFHAPCEFGNEHGQSVGPCDQRWYPNGLA